MYSCTKMNYLPSIFIRIYVTKFEKQANFNSIMFLNFFFLNEFYKITTNTKKTTKIL